MFQPRPCGCKGIRTCLICEKEFGVQKVFNEELDDKPEKDIYEYCHLCDKSWKGINVWKQHPLHPGVCYDFPGVLLIPDFITEEEERVLVKGCDSIPWDLSQSGRRKQNFGPKTNFKKKKINGKDFAGFPEFGQFAQKKLNTVKLLSDFQTIEQCAIEYRVETGACIDPHIDDCWVWGERVISLSLLADSFLTMRKYELGPERFNLKYYYDTITEEPKTEEEGSFPLVRLPMPTRSLLVLYGPARYAWEHCIGRSDIKSRRICMAYREFTPEYLEGGKHFDLVGKDILSKAKQFWV